MARYLLLDHWRSGSRLAQHAVQRAFKRPQLRVSFDIDDTLACLPEHSAAENEVLPGCLHRWLGEPLRAGTRSLFRELREQGCSIWIYTSSGRSQAYIRRWLLMYGIRVDGVVNSDRHQQVLSSRGLVNTPSKLPSAFDIDLHVDDSEGVRSEGHEHGFRVAVIDPQDANWTGAVREAVARAQAQLDWQHAAAPRAGQRGQVIAS
ncbi:hypothetical protein [Pseudomonas cremoricolorata]|uniref:hypothetical protein n=1 Tax=Pseudomonas cremoricolorata TaxID=157783 RepID=UPI000425C7EF|nr:hypothetical protein [Pseudomonas cremoricolorata]